MANATTKRRKKPRRGLGYTVETIRRKGSDGNAHRIRYRAYVWNASAQVKQHVVNPENGTKTFDEWDDADRAARQAKAELDGNYADAGMPVNRRRRRVLLAEYIDNYLEQYPAKSQSTQASRKTNLNQARKRFPGKHLHEITEADLLKWNADAMASGLAEATRTARIVHLSVMYQRAVKEGIAHENPCAEIHFEQPVRQGTVRRLKEHEFQQLIAAAPEWFTYPMLLAFDAAMRASEVAGLTWGRLHLDEANPWVHVKDVRDRDQSVRGYTKGRGERKIALSVRAAEALRALKVARNPADADFVVLHSKGQPIINPNLLVSTLRRVCDKATLAGQAPKFHHLRHSCLMSLARATKDVRLVQRVAGHRSLKTTQLYFDDEFAVDEQAEAMELRTKMVLAEASVAVEAGVVEAAANRGPGSAMPLFMSPAA